MSLALQFPEAGEPQLHLAWVIPVSPNSEWSHYNQQLLVVTAFPTSEERTRGLLTLPGASFEPLLLAINKEDTVCKKHNVSSNSQPGGRYIT